VRFVPPRLSVALKQKFPGGQRAHCPVIISAGNSPEPYGPVFVTQEFFTVSGHPHLGDTGRRPAIVYPSTYHDLSTWKGGGMGMFASANTLARYVRVFIEIPDQTRILINKLTAEQNGLFLNTMYYPSERNLAKLGASLRQTRFSASREPNQVTRFDQSGKSLGASSTSYIVASARDDHATGSELELPIIVELWEFSCDPAGRLLKTSAKKTVKLEATGNEPVAPNPEAVPKL
jgi:hypothetical protein